MKSTALPDVVAANLAYFMARDDSLYHNANALSKATKGKVSPNTIRNLLEPKRRTVTVNKPKGYPTLDTLEVLAQLLPKCETWMLIHPDPAGALRAMAMDNTLKATYGTNQNGSSKTTHGEGNREVK